MNDLMRQVLMQQAMDHGTLHNALPGQVLGVAGGAAAGMLLAPHSRDTGEIPANIKGGRTMEPLERANALKGMGRGRVNRMAGGLVGAIAGGLLGKPLQGALVAQTAGPNRAAEILARYDTQGGVTERDLVYLQSLMSETYAQGDAAMPLGGV